MFRFWKLITFVLGLLLGIATLATAEARAATKWEVAVVFLGSEEPAEFQQDADENMRELLGLKPNKFLRVSVYREFSDRFARVFSSPETGKTLSARRLFEAPSADAAVSGELDWGSRPAA